MANDQADSAPIPLPDGDDEPLTSPATIDAFNARLARGSARMTSIEVRMASLEGAVEANTLLTQADHDMTAEIREIVVMGKRFFVYCQKAASAIAASASWLRKALLWIAPPVAIVVAAYHAAGDSIKAWFHWGP